MILIGAANDGPSHFISYHATIHFNSRFVAPIFHSRQKKSTGQLHSLTRQLFSRVGGTYGGGWDFSQLKVTKNWPLLLIFMRNGYIMRCHIDDFLFSISLNFANLTPEKR